MHPQAGAQPRKQMAGNTAQNVPQIPFELRYSTTIDDATEATGISRSRLYELIRDKKVQTVRNGRRPLLIVASLLAALQ
jgi:hypothetical protein